MATGGADLMRLDCPICKKKMTQPTAFECLHFFCQTCVDEMKPTKEGENKDGYKCPICDEVTTIDKTPIVNHLSVLLGETDQAGNGNKLCEKCEQKPATERCLDCKEIFCQDCKQSHNSWSMLRNHSWEELKKNEQSVIDEKVPCKDHKDKFITFYCKPCQKPVCNTCVEESHKDHSFDSIKAALETILPKMKKQRDEVASVIKANEQSLDRSINHAEDLKKGYEELEKSLEDKYQEVLKRVKADYQVAKDKLVEIRSKQTEEIECFIKDIELRLKSAKNNVALTDAVLQRTADTSLLSALHSKLGDRLDKSSKDTVSEEGILEPVQATCKFRNDALESWVEIQNRDANITPYNLVEMQRKTGKLVKSHGSYQRMKFAQIGNVIWDIQRDSKTIHFLSPDLQETGRKELAIDCSDLRSVTKIKSKILLSTDTGLYELDERGEVLQIILGDWLCDLAVHNDSIYCLKHSGATKILIFKFDSDKENISVEKKIPLKNYSPSQMNTIQATNEYIYVAIKRNNRIDKYNHEGVFICSIGSTGSGARQFNHPRLCGSDIDGNILIADRDNNRFQVMTPAGQFHVWNIPGVQRPLYAAFIGDKLWVADNEQRIQSFEFE